MFGYSLSFKQGSTFITTLFYGYEQTSYIFKLFLKIIISYIIKKSSEWSYTASLRVTVYISLFVAFILMTWIFFIFFFWQFSLDVYFWFILFCSRSSNIFLQIIINNWFLEILILYEGVCVTQKKLPPSNLY